MANMTQPMKVVDTPTLCRMLRTARVRNFPRILARHHEAELAPYGRHVLSGPHTLEDGSCVRCRTVLMAVRPELQRPGNTVAREDLDFAIEEFNALPDYRG